MKYQPTLLQALAVLCLSSGLVSANAQAVFPESNANVLAGVEAVDAIVSINMWIDMPEDREAFQSQMQRVFELGLRRDGVEVRTSAPNYLVCMFSYRRERPDRGIVAYSFELDYFKFKTEGVHELLWRVAGLGTIGVDNLDASEDANTCVDFFAREWLRWNPRR